MKRISIKAQWVGQNVYIETTSNPSYNFQAPTLHAGIRELEEKRGFEVKDIFWLPPLQIEKQCVSRGTVLNEVV